MNDQDRLPRFLIIELDKDLLYDLNCFNFDISKNIMAMVNWLTRQIEINVHCKKSQIAEKKPGAIGSENDPTIIYTNMIQHHGNYPKSEKLGNILDSRFKFNLILHEAVHQQGQQILSIRSCSSSDHFDPHGNLTSKGKSVFGKKLINFLKDLTGMR